MKSPDRITRDVYTSHLDRTPLDPFIVSIDRGQLFQNFPEVEAMFPYNLNVVSGMHSPFGKNIGSVGFGRAQRRIMDRQDHQAQLYDVLSATCHLLDDRASDQQKTQIADFYIGSWLDSQDRYAIDPLISNQLRDTTANIDVLHTFFQGINILACPLQDRTMERIHDDPSAQYDLLKTLITVESNELKLAQPEDEEAAQDLRSLQWLNLLTLVNGPTKRNMISELLKSQLANGAFDSLITRDILNFVSNQSQEDVPETLKPVADQIAHIEHVAGAKLDDEGLARLATSIGNMPKEAQKVIYQHRNEFDKVLEYIKGVVDVITHKVLTVRGHDYEEDLYQSLESHFADLAVQSTVVRAIGNRVINGDANTGVPPRMKRRAMPGAIAYQGQAPSGPEAAELTQKPLELKYMDSAGNMYPQVEGQLGEVVERYLKPYNGDRNLRRDIEKILWHIAHPTELDKSHKASGILKLNGNFTVYVTMPDGSVTRPDLHELKPTVAVKLPLTTDIAKKTRVYVVYPDNETIVVVGISHKQSSNKEIARISGKKTTTKEKA